MKLRSLMVATVVFAGSLVFAQTCPSTTGSVCLVPSSSAPSQATTYALPSATTTTVTTVPYTGTMGTMPTYSASGTCPMMGASALGSTQSSPMMSASMQGCPMMGASMSAMPAYGYSATALPYSSSMYSMTPTTSMPMYSTSPMAAAPMYPTMGTSMGTMPMYSYQTMGTPSWNMTSANPMFSPMANFPQQQMAACPANIMPDTACIVNQVVGLRSDIRSLQGTVQASTIQMQGQDLVSRMNRLMAAEMLFRQQIAANPNMPGAQQIAMGLSQEADALNTDITSFNQELSMIPVDQRPYVAQSLNSFTIAVWDPATQRFVAYRNSFAMQAPSAYQPAFAANPWLQNWQTSYGNSVNNIAATPQTYASVNWWSSTRVLGSTEMYPGGVAYIPAGSMGVYQPGMTNQSAMGTMPMGTMPSGTTTTATGTTGVTTPTTTTPSTATTTTPTTPTEQQGIGY